MLRAPTLIRRARRAAVHLLALAVLASALLASGSAYAFCPFAQRVMTSACCGDRHGLSVDAARTAEIQREGCCEMRQLDVLPSGDVPAAPSLLATPAPPSPVPLIAPTRHPSWQAALPPPTNPTVRIRAGPPRALERCIRLQTFLH